MFSKSIQAVIIAAIIATATLSAAPAISGSNQVRDHRVKTTVRDHRIRHNTETVIVGQGSKSCEFGEVKLAKMGYARIRPFDCVGAVFHYAAVDGLVLVHATMSSHSGEIQVKTVGIFSI